MLKIGSNAKRYSVSAGIINRSRRKERWSVWERFGLLAAAGIVLAVLIWFGAVVF